MHLMQTISSVFHNMVSKFTRVTTFSRDPGLSEGGKKLPPVRESLYNKMHATKIFRKLVYHSLSSGTNRNGIFSRNLINLFLNGYPSKSVVQCELSKKLID